MYDQKERDLKVVNEGLNDIDKLFQESEEIASFFTSTVHLYTLFVAIDYLKSEDVNIEEIGPRLLEFIHAYRSDDTITSPLIAEYKLGASGRTLSKLSREKRVENLVDWIRQ